MGFAKKLIVMETDLASFNQRHAHDPHRKEKRAALVYEIKKLRKVLGVGMKNEKKICEFCGEECDDKKAYAEITDKNGKQNGFAHELCWMAAIDIGYPDNGLPVSGCNGPSRNPHNG